MALCIYVLTNPSQVPFLIVRTELIVRAFPLSRAVRGSTHSVLMADVVEGADARIIQSHSTKNLA